MRDLLVVIILSTVCDRLRRRTGLDLGYFRMSKLVASEVVRR